MPGQASSSWSTTEAEHCQASEPLEAFLFINLNFCKLHKTHVGQTRLESKYLDVATVFL